MLATEEAVRNAVGIKKIGLSIALLFSSGR
jgi:hypothetical protein